MAKEETGGVWRTIGGRRVFIKDGQSLADAMKESGKFNTAKKKDEKGNTPEDEKFNKWRKENDPERRWTDEKAKEIYENTKPVEWGMEVKSGEEITKEEYKDPNKRANVDEKPVETKSEFYEKLSDKEKEVYDDFLSRGYSKSDIENTLMYKTQEQRMEEAGVKFTQKQIDAMDKLANQAKEGARSDIKDFLSGKENYDGTRDEFIKDVADEWGLDKNDVEDMLHDENVKHPRNFKETLPKSTRDSIESQKARIEKEVAERKVKDLENAWLEHYNKSDFNNENWRKESDRLQKEREEAREDYDKKFQKYLDTANENDLSWQDKVSRNDIQMEKELNDINSKRDTGEYRYNMDKWSDDYYGTFRKYEKENAKLKAEGAKPDEEYVPLNSYGTYKEKRDRLEPRTEDGGWKDATWTGKEYTNDEFMENLEDENWHTERRMIQTAGLTNQEVEYIKDHTTFHNGSPSLNREKTQKLIDEAKAKYRNDDKMNETNRKIADHLQNVSNVAKEMGDEKGARTNQLASKYAREQITKQTTNETMNKAIREKANKKTLSQTTNQRYSGTIAYLKETGLSQTQINEIIKRMEADNKK